MLLGPWSASLLSALLRWPVRQKSPLTRDDLTLVYQHLPHPLSHDHWLFVTILLVGFFGLLRLGELVQPDMPHLRSISKISWRHDVQTQCHLTLLLHFSVHD